MTATPPARVLVRMPNWLGDLVMSLPAFGALRAHFGEATVAAGAPATLAPLLSGVPGVDEVVPLAGATGLSRIRADARTLRLGRFDLVVLLTNSFGSALAAWRAGVPARWGYRADARGWLLTRAVSRRGRRHGGERHHSRYYVRLVRGLGIDAAEGEPRLTIGAAWRERAGRLLADAGLDPARPLVGIAPGAAYGGAKRWPPSYVAALLRLLAEHSNAAAVLLGAPADRETGHEIESEVRGVTGLASLRAANLIGRTDLPALVGVLAQCRAFVSNDSGAMHLAAAAGIHVTALFGPTREWATAPLGPHTVLTTDVFCRPCMLRECPIDHRCMKRITPESVLASLARPLRGDAR